MATLHVLQGPDKGRTYQTPDEPAIIGRTSEHIQLTDTSTSRRHAEIHATNGSWVLADLNSSNGTYLNGQRIVSPTPLEHGDQIKVGGTLLVFSSKEHVESLHGVRMIHDLVDLDLGAEGVESSILSSVNPSEESVILQSPETADAVAAWNVVYKVAEIIGAVDSVGVFLERVTDILFDHLIVDHLILLMQDPSTRQLTPQVVRCRETANGQRPTIVTSQTIINHVLETRGGVLCANAMTDARFSGDDNQDSIHRMGLRSIICVPIIAHQEVHGVFHFDCSMSHHIYTHEQLRLAVAIGRLTGVAIENTRLMESRMITERLAATGETVAYLSHHIRNILQGMQGGAEVVELGIKKSALETVSSGWVLVRRNLDRIYRLAMNMLTFGKDRQPRIEFAQLNSIVEEVIGLVQSRADEKSVILLADLNGIPPIPLDTEGMHQVAHNIILNAIEAAPRENGRVNVRTTYLPDVQSIILSVSDNGPGIPAEDRIRVFDVFHSSKGQGGTGLGLAAANKVVAELGGTISVESEPDRGTTFHVQLPTERTRTFDVDRTHSSGSVNE